MTFLKRTALEIAMIVIGYIALGVVKIVGQFTVRLGRAVFSR